MNIKIWIFRFMLVLGFSVISAPAEAKPAWTRVKIFFCNLIPSSPRLFGCLGGCMGDESDGITVSISMKSNITYTIRTNFKGLEETFDEFFN